jgi:hypothetical protein
MQPERDEVVNCKCCRFFSGFSAARGRWRVVAPEDRLSGRKLRSIEAGDGLSHPQSEMPVTAI